MKANDFVVGELVRFKPEEEQVNEGPYKAFYGHLCLVEHDAEIEKLNKEGVFDYDCIRVRSIATGESTQCYVHRLEKHNEDR